MALIYKATLTPSKWDLLQDWIPTQPWCTGIDASPLEVLGAFRFDDPAGAVGIETHLMAAADGTVLQVPLTYRGAPLSGARLVGTSEHSVLGTRWLYDAATDPVYVAALISTIRTGGRQAAYDVDQGDGRTVERPSTAQVRGTGSGSPVAPAPVEVGLEGRVTVVRMGAAMVRLPRVVPDPDLTGSQTLTGTWSGQDTPVVLAGLDAN